MKSSNDDEHLLQSNRANIQQGRGGKRHYNKKGYRGGFQSSNYITHPRDKFNENPNLHRCQEYPIPSNTRKNSFIGNQNKKNTFQMKNLDVHYNDHRNFMDQRLPSRRNCNQIYSTPDVSHQPYEQIQPRFQYSPRFGEVQSNIEDRFLLPHAATGRFNFRKNMYTENMNHRPPCSSRIQSHRMNTRFPLRETGKRFPFTCPEYKTVNRPFIKSSKQIKSINNKQPRNFNQSAPRFPSVIQNKPHNFPSNTLERHKGKSDITVKKSGRKYDNKQSNILSNKMQRSKMVSKDDANVHFSKDGRCRVHGENFLHNDQKHRESSKSECMKSLFENRHETNTTRRHSLGSTGDGYISSNKDIKSRVDKSFVDNFNSSISNSGDDDDDENDTDDIPIADFSLYNIAHKERFSIWLYWKRMVEELLSQAHSKLTFRNSIHSEWELDKRNPNCLLDQQNTDGSETINMQNGGIALPLIQYYIDELNINNTHVDHIDSSDYDPSIGRTKEGECKSIDETLINISPTDNISLAFVTFTPDQDVISSFNINDPSALSDQIIDSVLADMINDYSKDL